MSAYMNALREEGSREELLWALGKALDELDAAQEQVAALREALIVPNAELIYLRKYGKDGALWYANDSKEVWRDMARVALAASEQKEEGQ